jgi:hypothetical protein
VTIKRVIAGVLVVPLAAGSTVLIAGASASAATLPNATATRTVTAAPTGTNPGVIPNTGWRELATAVLADLAVKAAEATYGYATTTPAAAAAAQQAAGNAINTANLAGAAGATAATSAGSTGDGSDGSGDSAGSDESDNCQDPGAAAICSSSAHTPSSDAQFNAPS